jgi:uncharacterized membrane protein
VDSVERAIGPPRPRFDPYPFIFLTLVLSLQASYAAPLILLAQNRQEARDRVISERDREQAAQSRADMDFLAREIASLRMSVGDWQRGITCDQSSGLSCAPSLPSWRARGRRLDETPSSRLPWVRARLHSPARRRQPQPLNIQWCPRFVRRCIG